jgi:hypothetical protein
MITPTAPAAWAWVTLTSKVQLPRSMRAILPDVVLAGLAAVGGIDAVPSSTSDDLGLDFEVLGAELRDVRRRRPRRAGAQRRADSRTRPLHRYICMRGDSPSSGVDHVGVVAVAGEGGVLGLGAQAIALLAAAAVVARAGRCRRPR